jgi:hypothetical protein
MPAASRTGMKNGLFFFPCGLASLSSVAKKKPSRAPDG